MMKFALGKIKSADICSSYSEAALDTPQSYFDEVISEYRERRDTLITELHKIEKVATQELSTVSLNFLLKMQTILQDGF
jgi:aspartate aminotransferase